MEARIVSFQQKSFSDKVRGVLESDFQFKQFPCRLLMKNFLKESAQDSEFVSLFQNLFVNLLNETLNCRVGDRGVQFRLRWMDAQSRMLQNKFPGFAGWDHLLKDFKASPPTFADVSAVHHAFAQGSFSVFHSHFKNQASAIHTASALPKMTSSSTDPDTNELKFLYRIAGGTLMQTMQYYKNRMKKVAEDSVEALQLKQSERIITSFTLNSEEKIDFYTNSDVGMYLMDLEMKKDKLLLLVPQKNFLAFVEFIYRHVFQRVEDDIFCTFSDTCLHEIQESLEEHGTQLTELFMRGLSEIDIQFVSSNAQLISEIYEIWKRKQLHAMMAEFVDTAYIRTQETDNKGTLSGLMLRDTLLAMKK